MNFPVRCLDIIGTFLKTVFTALGYIFKALFFVLIGIVLTGIMIIVIMAFIEDPGAGAFILIFALCILLLILAGSKGSIRGLFHQ